MFTGIVSGLGRIVEVRALGDGPEHGKRLRIDTPPGWLAGVALGDSIALNGACMTVVAFDPGPPDQPGHFEVEVSAESLARTAGLDRTGPVNLEQALRPQDRLGGHLVSGHVDGLGRVEAFEPVGESWRLALRAPAALARFLAVKGSITVQGVSLTVNQVEDGPEGCHFTINLIPHTLAHTTLGTLQAGDAVNLEVDLIARYVERMLGEARTRP